MRIVSEPRLELEGHEAVTALSLFVDGAEHIRRHLHIGERKVVEDVHRAAAVLLGDDADHVVVVGGSADRLAEDAWIGGHAAHAVLTDETLQLTAGDKASP